MKIFRADQVREIDQFTIEKEPVASIDLMERAALRLSGWYVRHFHIDRKVVIYAGPGNNGGDALAMARQLAERQYSVSCNMLHFGRMSEDCRQNLSRLEEQGLVDVKRIEKVDELSTQDPDDVLVDGIFGSGLSRRVTGFPAEVIRHINAHPGIVLSIDIPSGLFGEDNGENDPAAIVRADTTLTFQFPFLSFFFSDNREYTGSWRVHDIGLHPEIIEKIPSPYTSIERDTISKILPSRKKFAHKGSFGHALVISGAYGMMGAALLAGESCLRSGTGLVTLHVPRFGYQIIQTAFPEALVSLDQSDILFSEAPDLQPFSAIGIGPGLGCKPNSAKGLLSLLREAEVPLVIDADGLNLLSSHPDYLDYLPENTILTPHPKEFERLAGSCKGAYERHLRQLEFAKDHQVIIVLKGAYSGIACPDGSYFFNTTGNPGMATGGSGDVLTGLITGLLAQGIMPVEAAMAGVYLHGLAGDLAISRLGQRALIAGDIISEIGAAFMHAESE